MTLRTPRRRISPRTKLRYRAIREFFRRAIGSASQQEITINSSININVKDLKRKIIGLEEQLDQVSKHCRDIACIDNCSRRTSESLLHSELKPTVGTNNELITQASSDKKRNCIETQLIYKSPENNYKRCEDSEYMIKPDNPNSVSDNQIMDSEYARHNTKAQNKKNKLHSIANNDPNYPKRKTRSVYDNVAAPHSTSSFHSLANTRYLHPLNTDYPSHTHDRYQLKDHYIPEMGPQYHKEKKHKENIKKHVDDNFKNLYEEKPIRVRKSRRSTQELDQEFIADIIRRQYKPVKLFGTKESDLSQISAPVCRDQDLSTQENIPEDSELCSCVYGGVPHKRSKHRHLDLNRMRSVCDTRLYSTKKHIRRKHRIVHPDAYCDSEMYDLIPVKERSSPKTRRKFIEDAAITYDQYREVPPSPRTQRPRLNLKAQCYTPEDYVVKNQFRRRLPTRQKYFQECVEQCESDLNSDVILEKNVRKSRKPLKPTKVLEEEKQTQSQSQDIATSSSLRSPQYINEQTSMTINSSLHKSQDTEKSANKTDKALCEIKDILQSFLHEIKKETIASQCDKSDCASKTQDDSNGMQDPSKVNGNMMPNSTSFNNYNVGQCGMAPYVAPFSNPCCYPVVPLCPVNCPVTMPGSYIMPSQSFTCTNCGNMPKESHSTHCCNKNSDPICRTETEELIKEIYKYVAQSPIKKQDHDSSDCKTDGTENTKILTSRSVGGNYSNFHHDAKVGTQPLRCYSKSCEAIGSRMMVDPYYNQTNPSFSDTLLEKLSLEVTQSTTDSDMDITNLSYPYKAKRNRLSKVLRSFRIFKKKKRDVIEELSESESVVDDVNTTQSPPFRQEITNYMMYGQDYNCPEHIESLYPKPNELQPGNHSYPSGSYDYQSCQHDYQPRSHEYQSRPHEYQSQPHEYQSPSHGYQAPPHDYQIQHQEYQPRPQDYHFEYHPPYNPRGVQSPQPNPYVQRPQPVHGQTSPISQPPRQHPTAPPLNSSYDSTFSGGVQPPLCLREIEVKSTGTQSERKVSLFKKIKKKMKQPVIAAQPVEVNQYQRSFSTQTQQATTKPMPKPFFNWKKLQSKAMQGLSENDAVAFTLKTQKELAEGDLKIKKAMLKKLFHKRNPFSSRNLIMKTLLGKDKASFGAAPPNLVFKPRMFL